ncbi:hypothetical protein FB451DRAFT_1180489 [Mycena latifolia]|nr:hypothetical protein FB451DRAFT_1180489 [Mycena latifolia]
MRIVTPNLDNTILSEFKARELKIDGISLNAGRKMEEIVQIVGARKSPESRPNLPSIFTQIWKQSKKNIEAADAPQRIAEWADFPTVGGSPVPISIKQCGKKCPEPSGLVVSSAVSAMSSTAVAEALSLSLLLILDPEALEGYGKECADLEPDWSGYHELDLHRMEAAPVQLDAEATCDAS